MSDNIVLRCQCGQKLAVKSSKAGKKIRCPKCETVLRIPDATPQVVSPPPAVPVQGSDYIQPIAQTQPVPSLPPQPVAQPNYHFESPQDPFAPAVHASPVPTLAKGGFPDHGHELVYNNPRHLLPKKGIFAGIESIIFGVVHFGLAAVAFMALMHLRSAQRMTQFPQQMPVNVESGISGFFTNSQVTVLLTCLFLLGLAVAGLLGGIAMFRRRLGGWITVMITGGLSILLAGFLGYQYFSVLNALSTAHEPMLEMMNETAKDGYYSMRRQVHLTYWLLIVCYLGYAISVMSLLLSKGVFEGYQSGAGTPGRSVSAAY